MPNFTNEAQGLGMVNLGDLDSLRAAQRHMKESQRLKIPDIPELMGEISAQRRIFLWNVGIWAYDQPMGSIGNFYIPALREADCFKGNAVRCLRPVEGIPMEYYPAERGQDAKVLFHNPVKHRASSKFGPGADLALQILQAANPAGIDLIGRQVFNENDQDLRLRGCFVSRFEAAPEKPQKGADKALWDAWREWEGQVSNAEQRFREYCAFRCDIAKDFYNKNQFATVRSDDLFACARLMGYTEAEHPWIGATGITAKTAACIACSKPLRVDALRCPECGEKQFSDEVYEQKLKARREGAVTV